jgi:hypothetical protein
VFWFSAYSTIQAAEDVAGNLPLVRIGAAHNGSPESPRSVVFHTDWDDFPKLFSTAYTYTSLDSTRISSRLKHERLYHKYEDVTQERVRDMGMSSLQFGCVFTDNSIVSL